MRSDGLGHATRAVHVLAYVVYRAEDSTGRKQGTRLGRGEESKIGFSGNTGGRRGPDFCPVPLTKDTCRESVLVPIIDAYRT